ncbi:MAG: hypothetical protein JW940_17895 [Polyangiaceae bacterium]|nr:hypothetical protein [Polyangiaceae bacterium]
MLTNVLFRRGLISLPPTPLWAGDCDGPVISTDNGGALELAISCSEEAGTLEEPVPYALIVSIEVAPETGVQVYEAVATRLRMRASVPVRPGR